MLKRDAQKGDLPYQPVVHGMPESEGKLFETLRAAADTILTVGRQLHH
jgi:hypothetical protein